MQFFSLSDPGPRAENQDHFYIQPSEQGVLLAVADGVGGNRGGRFASTNAIDSFVHSFVPTGSLEEALKKAHDVILHNASTSQDLAGMATTLTATHISGAFLKGVHCGDSRAYLLRGHGLKQLTTDHTEVASLLASGRISKEEAVYYPRKNVLTSALGTTKELTYQNFNFSLQADDRLLLLTDGIYSVVSKKEIQRLSESEPILDFFCKKVVDLVKDRKPMDNFTLVAVQLDASDLSSDSSIENQN